MKKINFQLLAFIGLIFIWSCSSDDDMNPNTPDPTGLEKGKYGLVINEGGFQQGNSSLGLLNLETFEYQNNYFSSISNQPLGDIFNSMQIKEDVAYLVVNNSGKIEAIDLSDQTYIGRIEGFYSPRHMVASGNTAYVSNLFANAIQIVDLEAMNITGEIPTSGWTERMIIDGNFLIVACSNCGYVYRYNLENNNLVDSIQTGAATNFINRVSNERIIAFSSGTFDGSQKPSATLFTNQMQLVQKFNLPTENDFVGAATFENNTNRLFFIDGAIVYYSTITSSSISFPQPFVNTGEVSPYAISIGSDGRVFLSDAGDFSGAGKILVYNSNAMLLETIDTGIVPSGIVYYE